MAEHEQPDTRERATHHVVIEGAQFERLFASLLDRLERLEQGGPTVDAMAEAVNIGAGKALSNPENWCKAAAGLRAATERQAGPWFVRRGAWQVIKYAGALMLLVFVLATGGPTAAWALVKSWFAAS